MEKQDNSEEKKQKQRPSLNNNLFTTQQQLSQLATFQQNAQNLTEEEEQQKQHLQNTIRRNSNDKSQMEIEEKINPFTIKDIDEFLNNSDNALNQELKQYANELRDLKKLTPIHNTDNLTKQQNLEIIE